MNSMQLNMKESSKKLAKPYLKKQDFKCLNRVGPTGSGILAYTFYITQSICLLVQVGFPPASSAVSHSCSPSSTLVGSTPPLHLFPGGHHFPFPLHCRHWAIWRCCSSAHYRPRWANRGHGTVEHVPVCTATCHDCLSLHCETVHSFSIRMFC